MVAACIWPWAGFAADSEEAKLVAIETADRIELTVPVSRLILGLPKGKLTADAGARSGAQAHPRYFFYTDAESVLNVSGWFESADKFAGFKQFWRDEFGAMKKSGLVPDAPPTTVNEGGWIGIAYDLKPPGAPGVVATNIRAELLRAGTWVDLHISITTDGPVAEARARLMQFLKGITVQEKDGGPKAGD